jgi:hypothetical protein
MPVPLGIVAIAAARAIAGAAGKRVVSATVGKSAATKYATTKAASNAKALKAAADRKALKKIAKNKPLAEPKSAVKVKPANPTGRASFNAQSTVRTIQSAMGTTAKKGAAATGVTGKKGVQPPIKINTNPVKVKGPVKTKKK